MHSAQPDRYHRALHRRDSGLSTCERGSLFLQAFLDAKDVPQADAAIKAVFKISTDCLQARQMSAEMFMLEEKHEEAVAESGRILKMDPGNVPALLLRARAYYMLQDFDMAKRHYGEVLTKYDPDNKAAKTSFKELKALQRRIDSATKVCAPPLCPAFWSSNCFFPIVQAPPVPVPKPWGRCGVAVTIHTTIASLAVACRTCTQARAASAATLNVG